MKKRPVSTSKKEKKKKFMGHCITPQGLKVDNNKVSAIINMPPSVDVLGVKRLCGIVQYLAKFMPNLASDLEPIQALTQCVTGMIVVFRHLK